MVLKALMKLNVQLHYDDQSDPIHEVLYFELNANRQAQLICPQCRKALYVQDTDLQHLEHLICQHCRTQHERDQVLFESRPDLQALIQQAVLARVTQQLKKLF